MAEKISNSYKISSAIFWVTFSAFLILALHDFMIRPTMSMSENGFVIHTVGPVGFEMAQILTLSVGYGAFLVPALMICLAIRSLTKEGQNMLTECANIALAFILVISIMNLLLPIRKEMPVFTAGGVLGSRLDDFLFQYFDHTGTLLILFGLLGFVLQKYYFHHVLRICHLTWCFFKNQINIFYKWIKSKAIKKKIENVINTENMEVNDLKQNIDDLSQEPAKDQQSKWTIKNGFNHPKRNDSSASKQRTEPVLPTMPNMARSEPVLPRMSNVSERVNMKKKVIDVVKSTRQENPKSPTETKKSNEMFAQNPINRNENIEIKPEKVIPSLDLLNQDKSSERIKEDPKKLQLLAQAIECKLKDFGVSAKVMNILLGPIITRFEIQPAPGTKASKITGLARDLARSLSVSSVRIVEVITGKTFIGLEIPNRNRVTVSLKTIFESNVFQSSRSALCLALGVDISGDPVVVDLAKMPHLLVAGTTGSGKSVGLNTLLLSLLYKTSPDDLRLILIDPKMLEFAVYEGIPHLLTSVVTDMNDASYALNWCVNEMERRYKLMAELGVRNITGYNEKVKKMPNIEITDGLNPNGETQYHEHLPYIVVIADEFADMMMMVGKKVEQLIARLAQKARAAGIHLILATQRPSVDVITGLIKANIPTRISFQVSSKIDSRTIIDQQGAESLLGFGDMLYLSPGSGQPMRCHGAFVSDDAVSGVVDHLRSCGQPDFIDLNKPDDTQSAQPDMVTNLDSKKSKDDALYDQIVDFVTTSRKVSTSSVQRRFRIGYNRASIMVEKMEANGVVSPMDGNGQRKVIAPKPVES